MILYKNKGADHHPAGDYIQKKTVFPDRPCFLIITSFFYLGGLQGAFKKGTTILTILEKIKGGMRIF